MDGRCSKPVWNAFLGTGGVVGQLTEGVGDGVGAGVDCARAGDAAAIVIVATRAIQVPSLRINFPFSAFGTNPACKSRLNVS